MPRKSRKVKYHVIETIEFDPVKERKRIDACGKADPNDPDDKPLPKWVLDRMYKVCDALEVGDLRKVNEILSKSGYENKRCQGTIVAEFLHPLGHDLIRKIIFGNKVQFEDDQEKIYELKDA